jgi:hypothetical protein
MSRLKGEAGKNLLSPALSRNCKDINPSQDARQDGSSHNLADGRWRRVFPDASQPLSLRRGFSFPAGGIKQFIEEEK